MSVTKRNTTASAGSQLQELKTVNINLTNEILELQIERNAKTNKAIYQIS